MDRFALMSTFVRIVETGSLSATARELQTTQPTVSKQLSALEKLAGARLLERNTRAIRLTEAGQRYYEVTRKVLQDVSALESDLGGLRHDVRGRLRLSLPVGLGEAWLVRLSLQFQRENPDVVLDLSLSDRVVDLVEDGIDLAVRIGGVTDPSVVARHLGFFDYVMVAAPAYLKTHGTPKTPDDLARHNYLRYYTRGTTADETLETPKGTVTLSVTTTVEVNNSLALKEALVEGVGLGRCTQWLVNDALLDGRLVRILPGVAPSPLTVHAVYLQRQSPLRVRRFIEFLEVNMKQIPGWRPKPSSSR
ncbi:MAG: LysR substrate-binding domain-containing protein [Myxococcaceae bacterium]